MADKNQKYIKLKGVKTHGLKNVEVQIPHDKITTITGLSGSGKSSLAIDTLFAEGQRRYLESLSSYARQFLNKFEKPEFEEITGLRPSIAIEQKTQGYNPRSTVGTVTEIYDYLRVFFARLGTPYSPYTNLPLKAYSASDITNAIYNENIQEFEIYASIVKNRKGSFKFELSKMQKLGFSTAIIDNEKLSIEEEIELDKNKFHSIDILIASFDLNYCERYEIENACSLALLHGNGILKIRYLKEEICEKYFCSNAICPISNFALTEQSARLFSFNNPVGACAKCSGLGILSDDFGLNIKCNKCNGLRLNEQALCVKINGKNIAEITQLSLMDAKNWIDSLELNEYDKEVSLPLITQISQRLRFLLDVGLYYLTLERSAETLSGGESQRIRLASQIGSGLEGVLYVLDEPSIGLHPQDQQKLINTLKRLRDLGNTVVMVEHDEETMLESDYIIEMGPRAGVYGGNVVFSGTTEELKKQDTLTAQYLSKRKKIQIKTNPVDFAKCEKLKIINASLNNLKNVSIEIPLNHLIGICGVSGSGKSSLIMEVLTKSLENRKNEIESEVGYQVEGPDVPFEIINQSPIGRTPRSIPATYTGIMNNIRDWYAQLPESKARGYTSSRFSFNVEGGRCKSCTGEGVKHIEMHFLPDIQIQCPDCLGKRFNKETLEIKYNNYSIADILDLSVEEAAKIFHFIPAVKKMLDTLCQVHLEYIKLGQNAITLSGGEAQRVKLAKILGSKTRKNACLYILDEPTTGLHFDDIQALMEVLRKLCDEGNSILIIEHHSDVLKNLDWLIEMGPEGGKNGGLLVAQGTYEELKKLQTPTGKFL